MFEHIENIAENPRFEVRNLNFMGIDHDELCKRHDKFSVKLRKEQRTLKFQNKRNLPEPKDNGTLNNVPLPDLFHYGSKDKPKEIYKFLNSIITTEQTIAALRLFRNSFMNLSKEEILGLLKSEYIEKVKEFINTTYPDNLESEAVWFFTDLTSKEKVIVERLVGQNIVQLLLDSIKAEKPLTSENAIIAIGNIIGDRSKYRDTLVQTYEIHKFLSNFLSQNIKNLPKKVLKQIA